MDKRTALNIALLWAAVYCAAALVPVSDAFGGDAVSLKAYVDRKSVLIGDRVQFNVEVRAPKGTKVRFPRFDDYKMGDFEIKDSGERVRNLLFGDKLYRRWYSLAVYSVGKAAIPQFEVMFRKNGAKEWSSQKTAAIDIKVLSVLPAGKEPADIRGIKGPLMFRNVYWGIVSLGTALFLLAAVAFIFYKKLKQYAPVRLPHETALEELESIKAAYLQGGGVKEYYVGVSDCIRRYVERAFKLKAPEMTTEEFLNSLHNSSALTMPQKDLMRGFMNACDMVKFAKYAPTSVEAESLYFTAKTFVVETSQGASNPASGGGTAPSGPGGGA
jgi:hypothetical protein